MFGHDDHHDNDTTQAVAPDKSLAEPMDDGTLGMPTADPFAASAADAPAGDMMMPAPAVPAASDNGGDAKADEQPARHNSAHGSADSLISIKQEALQQLKPLVGHLNQTPEEKFRTTMMMIQAADDDSLIPDAYAAAKEIDDEKVRAQALLDVVNEINYFTTQHGD